MSRVAGEGRSKGLERGAERLAAHDYARLVKRWKAVAGKAGMDCGVFAHSGGEEIYRVLPRKGDLHRIVLYVSAGIHGDEAGATEGLVEWAEESTDFLREHPVVIFPCLNPWGLINNCRFDDRGRDLNRAYRSRTVPQVAAQRRLLRGMQFAVAMALHEDYDGRGVYLYEIYRGPQSPGERILAAAAQHIPRETRRRVDTSICRNGLVRRRVTPEVMPNHPEAFMLHFHHARHTLTLETPSEFSIHDRVKAQVAALRETAAVAVEISGC